MSTYYSLGTEPCGFHALSHLFFTTNFGASRRTIKQREDGILVTTLGKRYFEFKTRVCKCSCGWLIPWVTKCASSPLGSH